MTQHDDTHSGEDPRTGGEAVAQRTENMTSGELLRAARQKKKLSLDDVAAAIHVRPAQLRAIEEGNIDALPGMTYAIGFVKSYAVHVKLNPAEIANKFKTEHGAMKPVMPDLPQAEPIAESRMPDPVLVGVAGFFALVLLVAWAMFSGDNALPEGQESLTAAVTAAPTDDDLPREEHAVATLPADAALTDDERALLPEDTAPPKEAETTEAETIAEVVAPAPLTEAPPPAVLPASDLEEEALGDMSAAVEADVATIPETGEQASAPPPVLPARRPQTVAEAPADEIAPPQEKVEKINIRRTGRVVLRARQPTWVQIADGNERVVYKRVMRPGQQFTVPESGRYSLITTNAGGLDVLVDGEKAPALGSPGEIMRGISLMPEDLTRPRFIKSRIND